ncbi:MAG: glycosyltransferase family 4 protein [Anaerolineales bacterium]|nr:glycosyltransferase family 4 protein [Anaerolineales bacterium]
MHIGIVHYAAPPVVGGVELTIFHHARILAGLGHQVTVVAGQGDSFLPGVLYQAEPLVGSRSKAIAAAGRILAAGEQPANFESLVSQTQMALLTHLGPCDVVIGHNLFTLHKNLILTTAVYRLSQTGEGPPWAAWHHDFAWLRPQYQPELHPGEPWDLLRRPWPGVRHVTVSQAQQADLARLYHLPVEAIAVISPGIEPADFYRFSSTVNQLVQQWDLLAADCIFLLPARITRRKNIELGLRWLAAVREQSGWDARLVVTGPPGPHNPTNAAYLAQLLALRHDLNLDSAVHFAYQAGLNPGQPLLLADAEVAEFYQLADALFFPSQQEGFGIPVLEAGLARLPLFATDLPPFRESAGPWAALFSAELPPEQVAQTILDVLQADRAFQLRRRVLAHYTWRRIVETKVIPLLVAVISQQKEGL